MTEERAGARLRSSAYDRGRFLACALEMSGCGSGCRSQLFTTLAWRSPHDEDSASATPANAESTAGSLRRHGHAAGFGEDDALAVEGVDSDAVAVERALSADICQRI